jgi:hypothetical protein
MIMTVDVIFTSVLSREKKCSGPAAANRIICFNSPPTFSAFVRRRRGGWMTTVMRRGQNGELKSLTRGLGGYDDMPLAGMAVSGWLFGQSRRWKNGHYY